MLMLDHPRVGTPVRVHDGKTGYTGTIAAIHRRTNHLAAVWYDLEILTPDGVATLDTRTAMVYDDTPRPTAHAWCPTCRRRREVTDRHHESGYEGGSAAAREVHFDVTDFICGHTDARRTHTTATAPGAPYAPGARATRTAPARTHRTWED